MTSPALKEQWQIDQARACGCRGTDDMCPCQNVQRKSWFVERRMDWIAGMLRVYGYINRHHIQRMFGVSTPQASYDLREFQRRHPDACEYDRSAKRYVSRARP